MTNIEYVIDKISNTELKTDPWEQNHMYHH